MNQADYIKAITDAAINGLKVDEKLTVAQLKYIHRGIVSKGTISELETKLSNAHKAQKEAEALVTEQLEYIQELENTTVVTKLIVNHGRSRYLVLGKPDREVFIGGKKRKLSELKEDKDFVALLVKMKSPLLEKIEKEA